MTSQRVFETESIDLAFPATAGHGATIYRNTGKRDVFRFAESGESHQAFDNYEGDAAFPGKRLLNASRAARTEVETFSGKSFIRYLHYVNG